jgi:putative transcriptional regulator
LPAEARSEGGHGRCFSPWVSDAFEEILKTLGYVRPKPRRRRERIEPPEGLVRPPRRPKAKNHENPFKNPLAHIKQPLRAVNPRGRGRGYVEFLPLEVTEIRHKFHATQEQFARMFGISVETVRNWEQGKRRPHGPARALLRVARAHPGIVGSTLWRYRKVWWMD